MRRRSGRSIVAIGTTIAIVIVMSVARPLANRREPASLRCDGTWFSHLAEQGLARSATLRGLVADLERAHVIVFAKISRSLQAGVAGRTRFIGNGDGWRFLSIEVDDRSPKAVVLSMLGHELQHAVEIANAPDITDADGLTALYRRIGYCRRSCDDQPDLETHAALDAEHRVFAELLGDRW